MLYYNVHQNKVSKYKHYSIVLQEINFLSFITHNSYEMYLSTIYFKTNQFLEYIIYNNEYRDERHVNYPTRTTQKGKNN